LTTWLPALSGQQGGRAQELHENAAAWYEEHGLADDAIRHVMAAGQMTWPPGRSSSISTRSSSCAGEAATPVPPFNLAPLGRSTSTSDWKHLSVLLAWGAAGAIVAIHRFRWDPRPE
jgi:hypothetical protein